MSSLFVLLLLENLVIQKIDITEPIIIDGYGEWVEKLCERYTFEMILFRNTSERSVNALLNGTSTKTMMIGVFNYDNNSGKVFDRRKTVRS